MEGIKKVQAFYESKLGELVYCFAWADSARNIHIKELKTLGFKDDPKELVKAYIHLWVNRQSFLNEIRNCPVTTRGDVRTISDLTEYTGRIRRHLGRETLTVEEDWMSDEIKRGILSTVREGEESAIVGAIALVVIAPKGYMSIVPNDSIPQNRHHEWVPPAGATPDKWFN